MSSFIQETGGAKVEKLTMTSLRVLIMQQDQVIDVQSFDDPRQEFVDEFNRLNQDTSYWAVIEEAANPSTMKNVRIACTDRRTCEDV